MQIAYTIRRPHAASNGYISHLYLYDLGTDASGAPDRRRRPGFFNRLEP